MASRVGARMLLCLLKRTEKGEWLFDLYFPGFLIAHQRSLPHIQRESQEEFKLNELPRLRKPFGRHSHN